VDRTETREVWVSIRRTGNGDAPVEVTIDDCRYLGRQIDATSFELAPVAAECGARIVITQLADGTFELFIEGEEPSGSTCTIDEVAALA